MRGAKAAVVVCVVGLAGACADDKTTLSGPSVIGLSVSVSPKLDSIFAADTVAPGDTTRIVATVRSAGTGGPVTGVAVTFTSSDTTVATVDQAGLVKARGFGTVDITADLAGKEPATARVAIVQRTSSVRITPGADTIYVDDPIVVGDTAHLSALATDRNGAAVAGTRFTWRSSATGIATVDSAGLVRALALGTATISATGAGITANAPLLVRTLVKTVTVTAPVAQALVSDTIQLSARATGQNDQVLAGRRFVWRSETPAIASIDSTGRVIVLTAGTARFTATTGFVSSSTSVDVLPRELMTLDVGWDFTCAVANLGRGYCWGREGPPSRLGVPADSLCFDNAAPAAVAQPCTISPRRFGVDVTLSMVSAGDSAACGLSGDAVYCWGEDRLGQLGGGKNGTRVSGLVRAAVSNVRFKSVTVGGEHACALSTTDTAYCWGADISGRLGDDRRIHSTTPIPLAVGFETTKWSRLSAGGRHTCGISNGTAYCWGSNAQGQLGTPAVGDSSEIPVVVSGVLSFTEISAGGRHTCGVAAGGALYCWGANDSLQLGTPTAPNNSSATPLLVPGLSNVVQISAGSNHTCALVQGGQVYCWGASGWGQVGNGQTTGTVSSPALVSTASPFRSVSAGREHTCGIDVNNVTYCWGSNRYGALGNELQAALRATPQRVATPR